jgi:glycosyltransferase involved in cell wall biosynthesis
MKISIVITNHNYDRFLASAIDSALSLNYAEKEIIVVDDGSTDHSRSIIEHYGSRIFSVYQANAGQISAANAGFERSTGDIILFLDADDLLTPDILLNVRQVWHPNVSKVQFPLYHIDEKGRKLGSQWPVYSKRHTPEWVNRTMRRTGFYDTPPSSGNAWSARFLRQVFPLTTRDHVAEHRHSGLFDDYLTMLAPFFGEVISLPDPGGMYRIHGANKSAVGKPSLDRVIKNCEDETIRVHAVNEVLLQKRLVRAGQIINFERFWEHMLHRLIYKRFRSSEYPYNDNLLGVFIKYCGSVYVADISTRRKIKLAAWGAMVAWAPYRIAYGVMSLKLAAPER